jgi:hypothetical protein
VVTVRLPDEMVGKTIEVIAFEIDPSGKTAKTFDKQKEIERIQKLTADPLVDLSNFKFNRDEANNY